MSFISSITLPDTNTYDFKDKLANIYATCTTAAATAQKEVTITNFTLVEGMTIHITFTYGNTAASPTLKVNNLTAEPFYLNYNNVSLWDDGETVALSWDGTYWRVNNYNKVEVVRL